MEFIANLTAITAIILALICIWKPSWIVSFITFVKNFVKKLISLIINFFDFVKNFINVL